MQKDTIVALSTPAGRSAIASIRVTGPLCPTLIEAVFGKKAEPRYATWGDYIGLEGSVLDDVIYIFYTEGASYTGDAMLEINCHGNPLIVDNLIGDLCARGCRLAEPGEFTRVAFLNDRLDLAQAEAVCDLISAQSESALQIARKQLSGSLSAVISGFMERLLSVIAEIEVYIDFPEEDLPPERIESILERMSALKNDLEHLLKTKRHKDVLDGKINMLIVGAPNAGKSSFLNLMHGSERSLVSDIPGTTRDYVSESVHLGSYCINIMDTAGLRSNAEGLEAEGIERTLSLLDKSDFFILVVDQSTSIPELDSDLWGKLNAENTLVLLNKKDLPSNESTVSYFSRFRTCSVSLNTGCDYELICSYILDTFKELFVTNQSPDIAVNVRHESALLESVSVIDSGIDRLNSFGVDAILAADMRLGLDALGVLVGGVDNEDVLDALFGSFCIGK